MEGHWAIFIVALEFLTVKRKGQMNILFRVRTGGATASGYSHNKLKLKEKLILPDAKGASKKAYTNRRKECNKYSVKKIGFQPRNEEM
jgi:hypothetical protein